LAKQQNPREQLEEALATVGRLLRYWWIVLAITAVGTAAAVAFAMTRPRTYESSTVIMHRDVIPSDLLQGNRGGTSARYMKVRFKEMLLARPLLEKVIVDSGQFDAKIKDKGIAAAVKGLRSRIMFRGKGGGTFHISFRGSTPEMAQDVTALLAKHLIEWELRMQLEAVGITKKFLDTEAKKLATDLSKAEREFAEFLAAHPEFANETMIASGAAGASIRARNPAQFNPQLNTKPQKVKNRGHLFALERQRVRLNARLNRPANAKPITRTAPATKDERAAQQVVAQAKREVNREKRRLENLRLKFTDLHPDVQAAQRRVGKATGVLHTAQGRLAAATKARPKPVVIVRAVSEAERKQLQLSIRRLDIAIVAERNRLAKGGAPKPAATTTAPDTTGVVALETQWSKLHRNVKEVRERSAAIDSKAFTADIMASSAVARQGVQLTVVDPAELPTQPAGMGRKLVVMAGFFLSGMLGLGLAFLIVMMDDRVFHRRDIDRLEIAPVLTVIPARKKPGRG